ncbi:hypothetical protein HN681_05135 [archaeon]|jgi:23S rRNA G2445 N2-methylase RlmL|nr:hypothetical protein [archaeon]MBT3731143.1 hypothetical protein [archaeon]MBT4669702.1 hypothetical protein [archaeon]MBT5030455.1 hypothetical protein [archaeon]MBT5287430.1 hypothetical protein [archaeon]
MKYIAICAKGLEDITQLEIKELLNVESKILIPGRIEFSTDKINEFKEKTQSTIKLYELKQKVKSLDEIKAFKIEGTYRVTCHRLGEHDFTSMSAEQETGEKFTELGNKVDLKNPETIVFLDVVDENIFVGIDLTPKLLSKRDYRIKVNNQSINACIAYALVRLSGFNEEQTLLDPFAKDGVIAIEAAKFKKGKIYAFEDLFHNVKNLEINSKLANLRKQVNISRIEVEWLDTKLKENEIDCLITAPPYPSKTILEKDIKKLYKELFHQLDYIMKKNSKMIFIAPKIELIKEFNKDFKIIDERNVSTSNLNYKVLILQN